MNPLLLVRLFLNFKNYHQQISHEADEFDKKNNIHNQATKKASHIMIAGKVILTAMILGELPIDFFDIDNIFAKLEWMGVLGVSSVLLFGFLAFMALAEKENQRLEIHQQEILDAKKKP